MPPRSRKRKAYGIGTRSHKRRRVVRSGSRSVRFRAGSVKTKRYKRRFTKLRRRFKRKLRMRRRRRSNPTRTRNKLQWKLTEPRTMHFDYGQQANVPNDINAMECVYFTTEVLQTGTVAKSAITNQLLGDIEDVLSIADYAWTESPNFNAATVNQGWIRDFYSGVVFIKGRDNYTLRNQSNEPVKLTVYNCRSRHDQSRFINPAAPVNENVYNYLGAGFAERGFIPTVNDATNQGLTTDNLNPRDSRVFCRAFKIYSQRTIIIQPGAIAKHAVFYKWRKHQPADYTAGTSVSLAWSNKVKRHGHLKGATFALFKLHSNIAGVDGQTDTMKNIGQTTPTVILRTERRYWFKHFSAPLGSLVHFAPVAINTATGSIMIDDDEKKGAEADAS